MAAKVRKMMQVHRMLAHPSGSITQKTAEAIAIATTGQWRSCEACLHVKAKRHAVSKIKDERASVTGQRNLRRRGEADETLESPGDAQKV